VGERQCDWPAGEEVPYRVRKSGRAKRVHLEFAAGGLTVVVPERFDLRRIPAILEARRDWIETQRQRLSAGPAGARQAAPELPERIDLYALGETWSVEYRPARTRKVGVFREEPGRLVVYGAVGDRAVCREVLKQWLACRAREALVPRLDRLAREGGFRYREAFIRGQKTRWASCSSSGRINLSYKLLFLEPEQVRCVLLHELCHTRFLNHSARFWQLLSCHEPECRVIARAMRDGWRRVPAWVEPPEDGERERC
jgi:predicted metal-dependent hydrolase